ncbi:MAG TPA: aminotransferase class III-fold pyridoxal phosphate-dependent enzyme, partial [Blastocatellia bacterium]|nr:aminotransferase class III-fold pyridoxal phosphate-dependent enzyme [Blastocatellia bacterium]
MTSNGFRSLWKELVYPIVSERAKGAEVYDVDGNRYVDITMGFGVHLLGHAPDCVKEAMQDALTTGFPLGVQSNLAGEVAKLICDFSGMERVSFANSGTEAVMAAIRLARTVTRRNKIAIFAGSYHGWSDLTLARKVGGPKSTRSLAIAPGIPDKFIEEIVVLDYAAPESLEVIRNQGHELAAVLVEPVQSRRPDLQPKEFLHELRRITSQSGIALIFDEIITGFRIHPGGCQALFDVKADLAIYGKVLGGGLPVGVVAGSSEYIDAIDGGFWDYGDDSYPSAEKTLIAGTFCKHPMIMAAARAILTHLKTEGPSLQERLNRNTSQLVESLNQFCAEQVVPARFVNFGSLFRIVFTGPQRWSSLFYYLALGRGVLVLDGGNFFLSTAHTAADIDEIATGIKESLLEMKRYGWFPGHEAEASTRLSQVEATTRAEQPREKAEVSLENAGSEVQALPLSEGQKELWVLAQLGDDACRAFNESISLHMHGKLDRALLCQAIQKLVDRHAALRTTFSPDGSEQYVHPQVSIDIPFEDLSDYDEAEALNILEAALEEEANVVFDLNKGPVIHAKLFKLGPEHNVCSLTLHHILSDGWSFNVLIKDLAAIYGAAKKGIAPDLTPAPVATANRPDESSASKQHDDAAAEAYWSGQLSDVTHLLQLPNRSTRPTVPSYEGFKIRTWIPAELTNQLIELSNKSGCTLYMTLLGGYSLLLHALSGQKDLIVSVPTAGQVAAGTTDMVGYFVNMLPLRSRRLNEKSLTDYLKSLRSTLLEAYEYQSLNVTQILRKLHPDRQFKPGAVFNLDFADQPMAFADLKMELHSNLNRSAKFDIYLNAVKRPDKIELIWECNSGVIDRDMASRITSYFPSLLKWMADNAEQRLSRLSLLTPAERQLIVFDWNDTYRDFDRDISLHHLFSRQARRSPHSTAVVYEQQL